MKRHHHIYVIALCLLLAAAGGIVFAKDYVFKASSSVPQTASGVPKVNFPSAVPYFVTPPPDGPYVKVYSPVLRHYVYVRTSAAQRLNWYDHAANVPGWALLLLGLGVGAAIVGVAEHRRHVVQSR